MHFFYLRGCLNIFFKTLANSLALFSWMNRLTASKKVVCNVLLIVNKIFGSRKQSAKITSSTRHFCATVQAVYLQ